MSTFKIKRGDPVVVIQGAFKGTIGTVLKVDTKKNKAYVSGVKPNTKYKKKNASMGRTVGMMYDVPRPVHISNVMYYVEGTGGSRLGYSLDAKTGKKIRIIKKNGKPAANPTKNILISSVSEGEIAKSTDVVTTDLSVTDAETKPKSRSTKSSEVAEKTEKPKTVKATTKKTTK